MFWLPSSRFRIALESGFATGLVLRLELRVVRELAEVVLVCTRFRIGLVPV